MPFFTRATGPKRPAGLTSRSGMPTGRADWRLILLLGALAACGPISIDMYLPSLPSITQAFNVTASAAQGTLTSFMIGFSLGMLVYGPLSDAYGRRPVLLGGVALYLCASLVCALAPGIVTLVTMRFIQALGAGAASVLARAIARDTHAPHEAAKVLSLLAIVTSCGPLVAPLIGGQLLLLGSWRFVFAVLTAYGLACLVAAAYRLGESWPHEKRAEAALRASFRAYRHMLADPVVWGHMLCGGMAFAAMFAYITATPFVYINYFHVAPQHYGFLFGMNIVGIMLGNFANTRLVHKLGALKIISRAATVGLCGGLAVCAVGLSGWGGLAAVAASLFFVVAVVGVLGADCTTEMMHRYPNNTGAAAALFGAMQLGLGAFASLAVGSLQDAAGSPRAMGIVIGVCSVLCYAGRAAILRWRGLPARGLPSI
jgi:DHA1 family bicyclomycin/chloramphenicol resistance-like MFS transporter